MLKILGAGAVGGAAIGGRSLLKKPHKMHPKLLKDLFESQLKSGTDFVDGRQLEPDSTILQSLADILKHEKGGHMSFELGEYGKGGLRRKYSHPVDMVEDFDSLKTQHVREYGSQVDEVYRLDPLPGEVGPPQWETDARMELLEAFGRFGNPESKFYSPGVGRSLSSAYGPGGSRNKELSEILGFATDYDLMAQKMRFGRERTASSRKQLARARKAHRTLRKEGVHALDALPTHGFKDMDDLLKHEELMRHPFELIEPTAPKIAPPPGPPAGPRTISDTIPAVRAAKALARRKTLRETLGGP